METGHEEVREPKKILVITGESVFGERVAKKLGESGYEVKLVNNGTEGMKAIYDGLPHLILLDVILPGVDGYEVLNEKVNEPLLAKIPVFLMSVGGTPINMRKIPQGSVKEFIVALHADVNDVVRRVGEHFKYLPKDLEETEKSVPEKTLKKILWVEDDKLIGNILSKKLIASSFDLICVKNGEEAMKELEKLVPDAIMIDILLPGMSGFDILQRVKTDPRLKNVPTMILSNLSKPSDIEKAKMLGAQKFLVKAAVSLDQIVAEVRDMSK